MLGVHDGNTYFAVLTFSLRKLDIVNNDELILHSDFPPSIYLVVINLNV